MEKEEYRKIIKEATKQAYHDDPYHNCGPGNGCDDCRESKDKNKIETKKSKSTMEIVEIMTAEQANQLLKKEIADDTQCLIPIMESIKRAIKQKKNYAYISGGTPDYVIDKVKNLGYKVRMVKASSGDPRETDMYEINF